MSCAPQSVRYVVQHGCDEVYGTVVACLMADPVDSSRGLPWPTAMRARLPR